MLLGTQAALSLTKLFIFIRRYIRSSLLHGFDGDSKDWQAMPFLFKNSAAPVRHLASNLSNFIGASVGKIVRR